MTKQSDEWRTPPEVFNYLNDIYSFTVDGCASEENTLCERYYTKDKSFLKINPFDKVKITGAPTSTFINPPYSNCMPFINKSIWLMDNMDYLSVMLLKLDTSTKWFNLVKQNTSEIWFITGGRLSFLNEQGEQIKGNNFCSMIAVFNPRCRQYNNAAVKFVDVREFR